MTSRREAEKELRAVDSYFHCVVTTTKVHDGLLQNWQQFSKTNFPLLFVRSCTLPHIFFELPPEHSINPPAIFKSSSGIFNISSGTVKTPSVNLQINLRNLQICPENILLPLLSHFVSTYQVHTTLSIPCTPEQHLPAKRCDKSHNVAILRLQRSCCSLQRGGRE